jgi:hypothetical protein
VKKPHGLRWCRQLKDLNNKNRQVKGTQAEGEGTELQPTGKSAEDEAKGEQEVQL